MLKMLNEKFKSYILNSSLLKLIVFLIFIMTIFYIVGIFLIYITFSIIPLLFKMDNVIKFMENYIENKNSLNNSILYRSIEIIYCLIIAPIIENAIFLLLPGLLGKIIENKINKNNLIIKIFLISFMLIFIFLHNDNYFEYFKNFTIMPFYLRTFGFIIFVFFKLIFNSFLYYSFYILLILKNIKIAYFISVLIHFFNNFIALIIIPFLFDLIKIIEL